MRICILSHLFPHPHNPALGTFVYRRVSAMAQLEDICVIVPYRIFPPAKKMAERMIIPSSNFPVLYLPFISVPPFHFLTPFFLTISILFSSKARNFLKSADVWEAHWLFPEGPTLTLLQKLWKKPFGVVLRGMETFYSGHGIIREKQIACALQRASNIVSLSSEMLCAAQQCIDKQHPTSKKKSQVVIPNGVDLKNFYPQNRNQCRAQLSLNSDDWIVLSVGFLSARKGFQHLVSLWPQVVKKIPNAKLVLIGGRNAEGNTEFEDFLKQMIAESTHQTHISLLPTQNTATLCQYYNAADIFCLATAGEGSPNVLLEAVACGTPSIATNVGGVTEILQHPFQGSVTAAPTKDGWKNELLENLEKAANTDWDRQAIRASIEHRSWEACATAHVAVLKQLGL